MSSTNIYNTIKIKLLPGIRSFLFYQGSDHKIALTITLGFYFGIFPIVGSTSLLCLLAAMSFRLNIILIQALNLLFFPFQLIFMYPFYKAGRILFFSNKNLLPDVSLSQIVHANSTGTFFYLIESILGGIIVWAIFSALTGFFFYRMILQQKKIFVGDTGNSDTD